MSVVFRTSLMFAASAFLGLQPIHSQEPLSGDPAPGVAGAVEEAPTRDWRTLGLMRVRDMTPFGINRLDMLPAHAVSATPGTYAIEVTLNYQNTWAISDNAKEFLEARGLTRAELTDADVQAMFDLPGDIYLVDGEFGLVDLTLHYRFSSHVGLYATIPYYRFDGGFLDETIENFHDGVGFSNAGREFVPRDRFFVAADLDGGGLYLRDAPDSDFGDVVVGARYSLVDRPEWGNIILEGAYKWAWSDEQRLVSTGADDVGAQLSFQRFFRRNAFYLSLAAVHLGDSDALRRDASWLPTVVAGWETRLTKHLNFILQGYYSESAIQRTELDELTADKLQATMGIQWLYRGNVLRFGVTENLANFNNTPDVGVTLSFGRVIFGK